MEQAERKDDSRAPKCDNSIKNIAGNHNRGFGWGGLLERTGIFQIQGYMTTNYILYANEIFFTLKM